MQFWWVNHKRTPGQRLVGAYLWSAPGRRKSARDESSRNMPRVQPGDLIWLHTDGAVRAIGIALESATLTDTGWQLPVRFMELDVPLQPQAHASALAPVLPHEHSPLRASGACIPGVYLASIPSSMAAVPVSYTHLDANMRQAIITALAQSSDAVLTQTKERIRELVQLERDVGARG